MALLLSALLLAARLLAQPALVDPTGGALPTGIHLTAPPAYLVLAPVFTVWDAISLLSYERMLGLVLGLAVGYFIWRALVLLPRRPRRIGPGPLRRVGGEAARLVFATVLLLAFLLIGAVWHRPMLAIAGAPADVVVADLHSHSRASHDVRSVFQRGFDAEANRRWHARAGYQASFLTDHNTMAGLPPMSPAGASVRPGSPTVLCPGEEVSLPGAHIVVLGLTRPVDRSRYSDGSAGLFRFLRESDSASRAVTIGSLPEYEEHYHDRIADLFRAGLDGIELINGAPRTQLRRARADSLIRLARALDRFVVGVSDNHGWGATSPGWTLVRLGTTVAPEERCRAIVARLQAGGFDAVQIAARQRLPADSRWPRWLTPVALLWGTWRQMGWGLTISWLVWIWTIALVAGRKPALHR